MQKSTRSSRIFHRKAGAFGAMGWSNSNGYARIKQGLFVEPVKMGMTSVWPDDEIAKIQAAHVAGKSEAEIRALVAELHAARKLAA